MNPTFTEFTTKMMVNSSALHDAVIGDMYLGKPIYKRVFVNGAGFLAGLLVAREAAIHLAMLDVRRSANYEDTLKPKTLLRHRMGTAAYFNDLIDFFYPGRGAEFPTWYSDGLSTEEAAAQLSYFAFDNLSHTVLRNTSSWEYELVNPVIEFLAESIQLFGLEKPEEVKIKRPSQLTDPVTCVFGERRSADNMFDSAIRVSPAVSRALAKVALDAAKVPVEGVMLVPGSKIRVGASVYIAKRTYKATPADPIPMEYVVDVR